MMDYSTLFRHLSGPPKKGDHGEPTMGNEGVRGSLRSGRAPRDIVREDEDTNSKFSEG